MEFRMPKLGRGAVIAASLISSTFAGPNPVRAEDNINPDGTKIIFACIVADLDKTAIVEMANGDLYQVHANPPNPYNYYTSYSANITASVQNGDVLVDAFYDRFGPILGPDVESGVRITNIRPMNDNSRPFSVNAYLSHKFAFGEAARLVQDNFYSNPRIIGVNCNREWRLDQEVGPGRAWHGQGYKPSQHRP